MDNRVNKALFKFQIMPIFTGVTTPVPAVPNTRANIITQIFRDGHSRHPDNWHVGKLMAIVERISNKYLFKRIAT